jgi:hypothetical protein
LAIEHYKLSVWWWVSNILEAFYESILGSIGNTAKAKLQQPG